MFKSILDYFKGETTTYARRNRTIEIIALELGLDINAIKEETRVILKKEGRVETIVQLRKRFHLPLSAAWRFVDKLDLE